MLIVEPGGCGAHKEGEFYDTLSSGSCKVRFKTADFGQRMVMHCHVLSHEDNGAMTWMNVVGAIPDEDKNTVDASSYVCGAKTAPTNSGADTLSPTGNPSKAPTAPPTPLATSQGTSPPPAPSCGERNDPCPNGDGDCCTGFTCQTRQGDMKCWPTRRL